MEWLKKLLWLETAWCNNRKPGHYGGVDYFRILMPTSALNKYSQKYQCVTRGKIHRPGEKLKEQYKRIFIDEGFDGLIVKNISNPGNVCQIHAMCKFFNRKLIVDLDDDLFHIDDKNPMHRVYTPEKITSFKKLLYWCDAIFVENRGLQRAYIDFRTRILPNCVDEKLIKKMKKYRKYKNKDIRIGYFGSISHKSDIDPYIQNIAHILERYPGSKFVFYGGMPHIYNFDGIPKDRIEFIAPEDHYPDFLKKLAKLKLTCGIAPLKKNQFNMGKSPIKFYEYTMAGIPVVAQGDERLPYARVMKHMKNGLLFNDGVQFEQCMTDIIENPDIRGLLTSHALEDIKQYSIQNNWQRWEQELDKVFGG